MRELSLVGLSPDGRQVLFVDETGAEFAAPADDRLRAALRGDRARLGQLAIEMTSALRPRDIQSRIRAGDSPETVATLAQVPVEKIMAYCLPVLAERQHIAEVARRSHVRRKGAEASSRTLADVIAERLRSRGVDPRSAEWDAWRRDDGRWEVQASYSSGESHRSALFIFDAVGRYSFPEDDEAKWLTGEPQSTSKGPQPREGSRSGERRLAAVPDGDDLLSVTEDDDDAEPAGDAPEGDDLTAVARAVQDDKADEADQGEQAEEDAATDDKAPPPVVTTETAKPSITSFLDQALNRHQRSPQPQERTPGANAGAPTEPTPDRKRRGRRASVPSWDEIMFGKEDDGEKPPE